jgi:hypothetical protein
MNCQEFENSFEALARGALSDARERAEALAHEKACAACAARLADERSLAGGLRALAAGMKTAAAPARVEEALLAAFRARAAVSAAVEPTQTREGVNVVPFAPRAEAGRVEAERVETPRAEARRWSWAKTAAVASLAAAASLALFVLVQTRTGVNREGAPGPSTEVAGRGQQSEKQSEKQAGNRSENQAGNPSGNQSAMIEPPPVGSGVQPEIDEGRASRASSAAPRVRAVNASYNGGVRGVHQGDGRAGEAAAQEVATEFIPLMQGAQYASAEESHLVRVELPRTALASFGLPVNAEAPTTGRVKADVLLGEDGIARAIRFVR